jgi:hypothetical protein
VLREWVENIYPLLFPPGGVPWERFPKHITRRYPAMALFSECVMAWGQVTLSGGALILTVVLATYKSFTE